MTMSTKEDEFLQQLRATFAVEAAEHVQAMAAGLMEPSCLRTYPKIIVQEDEGVRA